MEVEPRAEPRTMTDDALASLGLPRDIDLWDIAESIPYLLWTSSSDGTTEYLNRRATEYTGRAPGRHDGWDWLEFVHGDDMGRARRARDAAATTGEPYELECRIRRHDRVYQWHMVRSFPVRDSGGRVARWICTATDTDERRHFEEQLWRSERAAAETLTLLETLQSTAPIGFGFVDRDFRIVRINEMLAAMNGGTVGGHVGRTVAEMIPRLWPDLEPVLRSVLDEGEAVVSREATGETAADPGRAHHWLCSFYPVRLADEVIGVGVVVVDITERYEAEAARNQLTRAAVAAIAATIDARDPYTAGHQRRVADIAGAIAAELGLDADEIEGIELAATIHDIGKIGIPVEILSRPGRLRPEERALLRTHPRTGYEIVAGIDFPWPIADMILQHHERYDGSGYPDGIRGDSLLVGARIIAVADTVEAMAAARPYRSALGLNAALAEIRAGRGTRFDPEVVDACIRLSQQGRLPLRQPPNVA